MDNRDINPHQQVQQIFLPCVFNEEHNRFEPIIQPPLFQIPQEQIQAQESPNQTWISISLTNCYYQNGFSSYGSERFRQSLFRFNSKSQSFSRFVWKQKEKKLENLYKLHLKQRRGRAIVTISRNSQELMNQNSRPYQLSVLQWYEIKNIQNCTRTLDESHQSRFKEQSFMQKGNGRDKRILFYQGCGKTSTINEVSLRKVWKVIIIIIGRTENQVRNQFKSLMKKWQSKYPDQSQEELVDLVIQDKQFKMNYSPQVLQHPKLKSESPTNNVMKNGSLNDFTYQENQQTAKKSQVHSFNPKIMVSQKSLQKQEKLNKQSQMIANSLKQCTLKESKEELKVSVYNKGNEMNSNNQFQGENGSQNEFYDSTYNQPIPGSSYDDFDIFY